ncbi:uncharacterized protein LOC112506206 [Cynara cardunculus var. scolymus]|uniref:uncharacterized protein LOC112506206 n=1 Tax=Cynara cardunculus var. scolymus TaxID=59895 RepID=UPI000D624B6D|nr:uncharacterized protein LOC112506206 [Cynara cardunculus var. scolymus]
MARINYKEFSDVISFDGTFRTNKHAMIFVPFLVVGNHKASIVVGSAPISGETIENFTWVLRAFLKCHEKKLVFVIMDQCSAMKQAISLVFRKAKHRLCMWHIMKRVPSKCPVITHPTRSNASAIYSRIKIQSTRVRCGEVDAEKDKCIIDVYSKFDDIISISRNNKSILAKLEQNLDKFMVDIEKEAPYEEPSQQNLDAIIDHLGVSIPDEVDILPPSGIRDKGCGTGKRLVSVSEKMQSKSKKAKRKCATCGQRSGHG